MTQPRITLRDLLNTQNRMEDKLDSFRLEINTKFDKFNKRITTAERFQANLKGKIAIVGGASMIVVNVLWYWVKKDILKQE